MSINECCDKNNLITPINSSSSDFENNLSNNQDDIKLQEPVIKIPKTQERKRLKIGSFCIFLLDMIISSFYLFLGMHIFFLITSFLYKYSYFKINSSNAILNIYCMIWIISGYLFSVGNLYNIFIVFKYNLSSFSSLPKCNRISLVILYIIKVFYCVASYFNFYFVYDIEVRIFFEEKYLNHVILYHLFLFIYLAISLIYIIGCKQQRIEEE